MSGFFDQYDNRESTDIRSTATGSGVLQTDALGRIGAGSAHRSQLGEIDESLSNYLLRLTNIYDRLDNALTRYGSRPGVNQSTAAAGQVAPGNIRDRLASRVYALDERIAAISAAVDQIEEIF